MAMQLRTEPTLPASQRPSLHQELSYVTGDGRGVGAERAAQGLVQGNR